MHCKRASFTSQKGIFYRAKGALLQPERASIGNQSWKILSVTFSSHCPKRTEKHSNRLSSPTHSSPQHQLPPSSYISKFVLPFYLFDPYTVSSLCYLVRSEIGLGVRYNDYRGDLYKDKAVFFVSYAVVLR